MSRKSDPHRLLTSALTKMLAPLEVVIDEVKVTPWASATFRGARHAFALTVSGTDALKHLAIFAEQVGDHDFNFSGHFVADILVTDQKGPRCTIEALTVEVE